MVADDAGLGDLVVGGHIAVRFILSMTDLASPVSPAPVYVLVRRVAFLVQFVERLSQSFQEFVSDVSCDPWMECATLGPIPWQYPAGALYDLLVPAPRPWCLCVHYSAFPSAIVMRFNRGANSARAHFLNSLKQVGFDVFAVAATADCIEKASVLMFGSAEPILRLPSERIQHLFDSLWFDETPSPPPLHGTDQVRKCLPVRFLTVHPGGEVRVRQCPLASTTPWTVAAAFHFVTGHDSDAYEFVTHGVVLNPADLVPICSRIAFYDLFAYICYRARNAETSPSPHQDQNS